MRVPGSTDRGLVCTVAVVKGVLLSIEFFETVRVAFKGEVPVYRVGLVVGSFVGPLRRVIARVALHARQSSVFVGAICGT